MSSMHPILLAARLQEIGEAAEARRDVPTLRAINVAMIAVSLASIEAIHPLGKIISRSILDSLAEIVRLSVAPEFHFGLKENPNFEPPASLKAETEIVIKMMEIIGSDIKDAMSAVTKIMDSKKNPPTQH